MMFAEQFAQDGCLVINRIFNRSLIERVHAEYECQYGAINPADPPLHMKVGDDRLHLPVHLRGALLDPGLFAHPMLMMMLGHIFEAPFLIDNVSIVTALPGAPAQRFHYDHQPLFPAGKGFDASLPCYALTVGIPLIDLDRKTGTTELYPRTSGVPHGTEESQLGDGIQPFIERGGCFFMDYRLWHRGLANTSDRPRPILYIVYARDWFTDVRNIKKHARFLIDREDLEAVPEEHRPLLRRAAAKGLIDATIKELRTQLPVPNSPGG